MDKNEVKQGDIIIQGKYSLLGSVHGKIKVIEDFNDLVEEKKVIEKDDIVVAVKTANYWNQYLTSLKGIVTLEGSPTSHPMLIGRERKLCCIVGVENCIEKLKPYDGKWVTLDGNTKCIYNGIIKLIEIPENELNMLFQIVEKPKYQTDIESINFLKAFNRIIMDENNTYWIASPQYDLCNLMGEIVMNGYKKRLDILNQARKNKININIFGNDFKLLDKMAFYKYISLSESAKYFENMDFEDCEKYNEMYSKSVTNLYDLSLEFEKVPSKISFLNVISAFENLFACYLVSYYFRSFLEYKACNLANEYKVSKYHFDRFSSIFQSYLIEEDNCFRDSILNFAVELLEYSKKNKFDYKASKLELLDSKLSEKLFTISISYRISKNANFQLEPQMKECYKKVLEAIMAYGEEKILNLKENILNASKLEKDENEDYFYNTPELRNWIELSIKSRVQHCNAHHIKIRAQFRIKFVLEKLEKILGLKKNEIFQFPIAKIADLIENHFK